MVLSAASGIDAIARIAGAPSPRSTICFSEKFAAAHLTRISASGLLLSLRIVIRRGTSPPDFSEAGTQASVILRDSLPGQAVTAAMLALVRIIANIRIRVRTDLYC